MEFKRSVSILEIRVFPAMFIVAKKLTAEGEALGNSYVPWCQRY